MFEFISNNSIWFIIGLILIALVVIGYFVSKTDFYSKKDEIEKEEKESKENNIVKEDKKVKDNVDMDIPFNPINNESNKEENLDVPFGDTNEVKEDLNVPFGDTTEDLSVPFGDKKVETENKDEDIWNF